MAETVPTRAQLVVLGGGPGGYPAAFEAADHGMDVVLADQDPQPGGVCLNRGCIPSKALLHVAKLINETRESTEWGVTFSEPEIDIDKLRNFKGTVVSQLTGGIRQLLQSEGCHALCRLGGEFENSTTLKLTHPDGSTSSLSFDHCIIAVGSRPTMPGMFDIGDERVMDSTGALELPDVPGRMLVIGGGYIGLEMGCVYAALGSEVSVVEMLPHILAGADRDLVNPLKKRLDAQFAAIHTNTKVLGLKATDEGIVAEFEGEGIETPQTFDRVLCLGGTAPEWEEHRPRKHTSSGHRSWIHRSGQQAKDG